MTFKQKLAIVFITLFGYLALFVVAWYIKSFFPTDEPPVPTSRLMMMSCYHKPANPKNTKKRWVCEKSPVTNEVLK